MPELVLVVEDEPHVRELVSYALQGAGYHVRSVADGESGLREALYGGPDLVVLDIRLPGMDGWEVCRLIRQKSNVPILIMTALGEDESLVKGLRLGADDWVAKPFSPAVLAARVQALLRRAGSQPTRSRIALRGMTIDLDSTEVKRGDEVVHLTPTEFRLLAALAHRPGQVIGARELMRLAQNYDLSEREAQEIVKVHVRHLRHKIEPQVERPRYVLTVRGMGYMLNRDELLEDDSG
ncbi:MAG TPA: response regulator transcription factor [Chloroflexota bacterium]|jgi:two-component system response regulator MtrA|nr:response regulator transcription factor [Chloroflexota bacterium]